MQPRLQSMYCRAAPPLIWTMAVLQPRLQSAEVQEQNIFFTFFTYLIKLVIASYSKLIVVPA